MFHATHASGRELDDEAFPGIVFALTGALATEADLPIAGYDDQTPEDITNRLAGCSRLGQRLIGAYEAQHENRTTITDKAAQLIGDEPWSVYDRAFAPDGRDQGY